MISTTLILYLKFNYVKRDKKYKYIAYDYKTTSICVIEMRLRSKMDSYQSMSQIPWGGHSPISSLYHQQQQQSIQEYKSENNSLYGSPYTPIIHTPDISPVASPEPDGKFLK